MKASFFSNLLFSASLLIANFSSIRAESAEAVLKEAQATYQRGGEASNFWEREEEFNQALSLFQSLFVDAPQSSDLNEVLGNLYLELNVYPWAVLHYERTLWQGGGGANLLSNLREAEERLGISDFTSREGKWNNRLRSFFRHTPLVLGSLSLAFFSLSCAIWFPSSVVRKGAFVFLLAFFILGGSHLFFYYFSPVQGVIIQSTGLYREPNQDLFQLMTQPLQVGSKVEILKVSPDGQWLKIKSRSEGYIPIQALQPISP